VDPLAPACPIHIAIGHLAYAARAGDLEALRGVDRRLEPLVE
jgi:hypothetical protein